MKTRLSLAAAVILAGCSGMAGGGPTAGEPPPVTTPMSMSMGTKPAPMATSMPPAAAPLKPISAPQTRAYLELLAPALVGRVMTPAEQQATAMGEPGIARVLGEWKKDPGLVDTARLLMSTLLATSGSRDGIDFDMPGRLAAHVAKNELPWSTVLTSDSCYDKTGKAIPCDTGAPYSAGVLTTRAFMASRIGRFNLTRAGALLQTFACREYPVAADLEPRVAKANLINMFQADTETDQADARAANGFGNGFACYACHGQFSLHAQLFVKYDEAGKFIAAASGKQDPKGELGRALNGLYASHFQAPDMAASEQSQFLGQKVANLAEAARVMASHPIFVECASRKVLDHVLGIDSGAEVDAALLTTIANRARMGGDPPFSRIVYETFADPLVIRTVVAGLGAP